MLSGSEWHILHLASGLMDKGHEVHFLALVDNRSIEPADKLIGMFLERNIPVHRLLVQSDFSTKLYKDINKVITEGNYDLVHSHLIRTDFILSLTKAFYNRDMLLISSQHTFDEGYQMKYGFEYVPQPFSKFIWVSKFTQRFIDGNISMSKNIRDMYVAHKIYTPADVEVIYHGFDFSHVKYDTDTSKYRKSPKQLLIVGRLIDWKGHTYIIDILPDLIKKYGDDISLVIVGRGVYGDTLKSYVKEKGLEKYVHFEGFSIHVHDYIANSDMVLIPSKVEGFCVVLMEAYYSKTPLAAFDVPALNENIFHRETGMLAPPYDIQIFKNNIIEVLDNPELSDQLVKNGREYLDSYLNIERMTSQTISYYEKTLANRK